MSDFLPGLLADLRRDEGFRAKPYLCPAGHLSIGFGRNLDDHGISMAEAEVMLAADVDVAATACRAWPWFGGLSPGRKAALVNMAFNMGMSKLSKFERMLAAFAAGAFAAAAAEAENSLWYHQVGERARRVVAQIREG